MYFYSGSRFDDNVAAARSHEKQSWKLFRIYQTLGRQLIPTQL